MNMASVRTWGRQKWSSDCSRCPQPKGDIMQTSQIHELGPELSMLQNGLREFGLNPIEWSVEQTKPDVFLIKSNGEDIAFEGSVLQKDFGMAWNSIQLVGF